VDSAFEQIRLYSKTDVAVSLRMLRALGDVASTTEDVEIHQVLLDRANRIVAGCAERLGEHEMREIRIRFSTLQDVGGPATAAAEDYGGSPAPPVM
jgi:uncharacterized membrane protein